VNTASAIVLQTVFGLDDAQVQALLTVRDGPDGIPGTDDDVPFRAVPSFSPPTGSTSAVPSPVGQISPAVTSSFFTVKSTGTVGGVKHTILATLRRDSDGTVQTVMWRQLREGS
jgi:hypothetical protein